MGISLNEFWELNPRTLNVITEAYRLKRKVYDEEQWLLGGYFFNAVTIALGNAFKKKNVKARSYFEEIEKPFLSEIDAKKPGEMSEEEKQKKLDLLMAQLRVKQSNFELKHGK